MELKEKVKIEAQNLLAKNEINVFSGEKKILKILQEIINNNISAEDIEITQKTLINIENYLYTKSKMITKENDFKYLKNIAEILRNQKVRIEDSVAFESPIFKVSIDDNEGNCFYFVTREGAEEYIKANSTTLKHLPEIQKGNATEERRKINLFNIETNRNLEIERIIEIIKRNF